MALALIGTGTEVGKTVASAVLLARYAGILPLAYWKPIATGARDGRDSETVARLAPAGVEVLPEAHLFAAPLSPHFAARLEGGRVEPARVLAELERHRQVPGRGLVVEGVGGLLVPLTDKGYLLADLLAAARLPCLVVASSRLGTINHTLLTLEALRARGLEPVGVALSGPPEPENRRAIERFGRVEVLAEIGPLPELTREAVARAVPGFDPEGRLAALLPE